MCCVINGVFKGLVVTDYTAVSEMINHGIGDLQTVSAKRLLQVSIWIWLVKDFLQHSKSHWTKAKLPRPKCDNACRRILEAKYKLDYSMILIAIATKPEPRAIKRRQPQGSTGNCRSFLRVAKE
jgi:beta-glucosidase-like glycosyl hydrolase